MEGVAPSHAGLAPASNKTPRGALWVHYTYTRILDALAPIPLPQWPQFFNDVSIFKVSGPEKWEMRLRIFEALARIDPRYRRSLQVIFTIIKANMDRIEELSNLDPSQWRDLVGAWVNHDVGRERRIITEEQARQLNDALYPHVTAENIRQWRLPQIETPPLASDRVIPTFQGIVDRLNLSNPSDPNYLRVSLLDDYLPDTPHSGEQNQEAFYRETFPRLLVFLKFLWGIPLGPSERQPVWNPDEATREALRRGLSFVFSLMEEADPDQLMVLFLQFCNAFVHCQTGQREGLETLIQSLLGNKLVSSVDFRHKLAIVFAKVKEQIFRNMFLVGDNAQNVHILNHYRTLLEDILGLSITVQDFHDPYAGISGRYAVMDASGRYSVGGPLFLFYRAYSPRVLARALFSHTRTFDDYKVVKTLDFLKKQKRRSEGTGADLDTQIVALEQQVDRLKIDKPFWPTEIADDLNRLYEEKRIDMVDGWWGRYFTADPMTEENFELTEEGAFHYLVDTGIVVAAPAA